MPALFWYLCTVIKSYPRSWLRLALLCLALMIGCLGVSAVLVINQGAKQSYAQQEQGLLPLVSHQLVAALGKAINKADYAHMRRKGVVEALALSRISTVLFDSQQHPLTKQAINITGFDSLAMLNYLAIQQVEKIRSPHQVEQSELRMELARQSQTSAFVNSNIYAQLQADTILTALGQDLPPLQQVNLATMGHDIVMDITFFAQRFGPTPISEIYLMGDIAPERLGDIRRLLPAHLSVLTLPSPTQNEGMSASFHLNLLAMALLMFVVCLFIVMNACQLLIMQRLPMLKVLRQLGVSRLTILGGQLIELLLLACISAAVGVYLGVALALYLAPGIQATLESLYRVNVGFAEISYLSLFVQVLLLSAVGITLAALLPIKQLNQNLSHGDNYSPLSSPWFAQLAGLTLVLAVIALWWSHTMVLSFLTIALFILAGCFALITCYPYILNRLRALLPERWPLVQWSLQHSLWLSGRSKIACCAFFIALMSNIGMNLMVDSFRQATHAWLDQRLMANYYLYPSDEQDVPRTIKRLQLDIDVIQRFEQMTQYAGLSIQVHSHPSSAMFLEALKTQQQLPQAGAIYATGQGAYVNQQFALRHKITLGQSVTVPLGAGVKSLQVVGIIYDYGNPYGQILLPPQVFPAASKRANVLALYGSEQQIGALREALEQQGLEPKKQLYSAKQLLDLSMATFERTFIITDSLNLVTLLVAATSLACGIIVLMQDTRPQLTLLRAMGVSRRKLQSLSLGQFLCLCLIALVFAIPFGILLGWLLINLVNKQAFYWTYPLHISVGEIAVVSALSLVLVSVIILLPLLSANNRPLIKDIRWLN
ncbi:MAG: putative ABC transport system permease protein [Paraglaciecola sp.]|jgi:putative ABC transport system permease protein